MKTWSVVDRPKDKPIVKSRWVFKMKRNQDGVVVRYKARLVAKGYTQTKGVDFNETFAPVMRTETLRYLISYATAENLEIHNMDVETAFLNGDLEEEIYMEVPEGFDEMKGKVCKLNKTLYGLKQSAREWNTKFVNEMKTKGFSQSTTDPCVFFKKGIENLIVVSIFVDDNIIIGTKEDVVETKEMLSKMFKMKDLMES